LDDWDAFIENDTTDKIHFFEGARVLCTSIFVSETNIVAFVLLKVVIIMVLEWLLEAEISFDKRSALVGAKRIVHRLNSSEMDEREGV